MLVLTRRPGERIILTIGAGQVIAVEVLDVRNGAARLGLTAPPSVRIDRAEVHDRIESARTGENRNER